MAPADIISGGLIAAMNVTGVKFKKNEIYMPGVLMAARAMHAVEAAVITWLVDVLQEVVDVPMCIDSPSHQVLEAGLSRRRVRALVNSISAEREGMQEVLSFSLTFLNY